MALYVHYHSQHTILGENPYSAEVQANALAHEKQGGGSRRPLALSVRCPGGESERNPDSCGMCA